MAKKEETTASGKIASNFNMFLIAKKRILIGIAVALVVIVIGLWIGLTVAENRADSMQLSIDNLQDTYSEWNFLEDKTTSEAKEMKDSLVTDLTDLADKSGDSYPVLKATYLLGLIAYDGGEYDQALAHFLEVAKKGEGTYLESLSLYNAGVVSEQLGNTDKALEYYQTIYDTFGSDAAESAKALFSVARLQEAKGDVELARAVLQQLADEFPSSEYAKLAQTRLVTLR